jgi:uncharacterized protein (TIGR02145 family)
MRNHKSQCPSKPAGPQAWTLLVSVTFLMLGWTGAGGPHGQRPAPDAPMPIQADRARSDTERIATLRIGDQEWMAENLRTSTYRNGDSIPEIRNTERWTRSTQGAWCHYDNDSLNEKTYGKLYNWYAVQDPRGLCPKGWHVPSDDEWSRLADSLGGSEQAGGKLKSTIYWEPPNALSPAATPFDARPGGYRYDNGFYFSGSQGYWWSRTPEDSSFSWSRVMANRELSLHRISFDRMMGFSVRCIRDR